MLGVFGTTAATVSSANRGYYNRWAPEQAVWDAAGFVWLLYHKQGRQAIPAPSMLQHVCLVIYQNSDRTQGGTSNTFLVTRPQQQ